MKRDFNKELLDIGEADTSVLVKDERSDNLIRKSISYLIVFVGTSILYQKYVGMQFTVKMFLYVFLINLSFPLIVGTLLEYFRKWRSKSKEKKTGVKVLKNPMWFEIIESAFAIYLLFMIVALAFMLFT